MSSLPASVDVVVVGGGIVGAATAAAVAARGARVVLVEKEDGPAREGSGRAQGSLRVQGRHGGEFALAQEALKLWSDAAQDGDFEMVTGGNLYFQTQDEELPVLQRLVEEAHHAGLAEVQLLDAPQTREVIPAATGPSSGRCGVRSMRNASPKRARSTTSKRRARRGPDRVRREGHQHPRVHRQNHRRRHHCRWIRVGAVVVAGGVWTPTWPTLSA